MEMLHVSRHDRQVVHERRSRDLLVEFVLRMRYPCAAPDLTRLNIESEDLVLIVAKNGSQPALQQLGLRRIAAMADQLDPSAQLADRDDRQVHRLVASGRLAQEGHNARVRALSLACLA